MRHYILVWRCAVLLAQRFDGDAGLSNRPNPRLFPTLKPYALTPWRLLPSRFHGKQILALYN